MESSGTNQRSSVLVELDSTLLGLICSYMTIPEIIKKVSVINKRVHWTIVETVEESEAVWKSIIMYWRMIPETEQQFRGSFVRVDQSLFKYISNFKMLQNAKWIREITML